MIITVVQDGWAWLTSGAPFPTAVFAFLIFFGTLALIDDVAKARQAKR